MNDIKPHLETARKIIAEAPAEKKVFFQPLIDAGDNNLKLIWELYQVAELLAEPHTRQYAMDVYGNGLVFVCFRLFS